MKIKEIFRFGRAALPRAVAAAVLAFGAAQASASTLTYDFSNNISGDPGSETGAGFTLEVSHIAGTGNGQAAFTFTNNSHVAGSAITGIYFYDGVVLGNGATVTNDGTSFAENTGAPAELPGINDYFGGGGPNFPATKEFYTKVQGINGGVFNGDSVTITIDLAVDFSHMIQMLEAGFGIGSNFDHTEHFVIGVFVQGLEDGGSAQYVVDITPIPLPAPVWMGLAGLAGVVVLRRRRN